jgi:hypothetical protein
LRLIPQAYGGDALALRVSCTTPTVPDRRKRAGFAPWPPTENVSHARAIGWTVSSEATYIGLARRNAITLIVTVLHCTSLQEVTSAEKLLDRGFAMNGTATPVGMLVPPLARPAVAVEHPKRTAHISRHLSQVAPAWESGRGAPR